jgi:hypothetical protein
MFKNLTLITFLVSAVRILDVYNVTSRCAWDRLLPDFGLI